MDRVAFMDVVIMQCALAEILSFPNIPVLGIILAFVLYYAGAKIHPEWDKASELN